MTKADQKSEKKLQGKGSQSVSGAKVDQSLGRKAGSSAQGNATAAWSASIEDESRLEAEALAFLRDTVGIPASKLKPQ